MAEPDRQERPPRRDENFALRDSPDVEKGGIAKEDSEIEGVSRDSVSSPVGAGDNAGPDGPKD